MKMWSGRFRQPLDPHFEEWQRSFPFDQKLLRYELAASHAAQARIFTFGIGAGCSHHLVKALARAFRWRRMLETGRYGTITDLAAAEKINASYVSRVLRLTLLAPDIVEAILDGRQTEGVTLPRLMQPFSVAWQVQRAACS